MGSIHNIDGHDQAVTPDVGINEIRLRTYQAEMLEASLKDNIIVVQDTGSGKTHIALARTAAELETCDPNQLVWFLAPTVALCEQQYNVFRAHLPAYETQLLSGKDNVDHWTDQATWDSVLHNVRIVLSTHQVLYDAMSHGFVKMRKLALLIFDEAHHCTGKHPANRILSNFYLPKAHEGARLPKILGLSASPVMKAKASTEALEEIERNMSAITKTPKVHRSELLRFVHRPELIRIDYSPVVADGSPLQTALKLLVTNYDFSKDPYILDLVYNSSSHHNVGKKIEAVYLERNTYCFKELKSLLTKYESTAKELGVSVADWCLTQCIAQYQNQIHSSDQLLDWSQSEKQHLQALIQQLPLPENSASLPMSFDNLSPKVETLIDLLASEASHELTGLMFAEQRVWVAALAELLSLHPKLQGKLSIGTFVGTSSSSKRKSSIANLIEPVNQQNTLDRLKAGDIDLIIATSVLEEGIDVSECHLVVCFESPKNLKSFVQRRGRARRVHSKYVIFSSSELKHRAPASWERLEQEMKDAYEDDMRRVKAAEYNESIEEAGERFYEIDSTGALLTLDNAVSHLYHFCALLGSGPYVDLRPQFALEEDSGNIAAEVILPLSVDPTLRVAHSLKVWRTERMAIKDAAFEAYKMLHQNGLVNDNLLPVKQEEDQLAAEFQISDKTSSLIEVYPALDPWRFIAKCQQQSAHAYHRTILEFRGVGDQSFYLDFYLPIQLPALPELTFFWNESKKITVTSHWRSGVVLSSDEIQIMRRITRKILTSIHSRVDQLRDDLLWLIVPSNMSENPLDHTRLQQWDIETDWFMTASDLIAQGKDNLNDWGQIQLHGDLKKWFAKDIDVQKPDRPMLHLTRVPKRLDFVYPIPANQEKNEAYTRTEIFPAAECSVNLLPRAYSICAMLMPSILYRYETYLTTNTLRLGLLEPLTFGTEHLPLLVQALTSSSTGDITHYQRLEFFGDCIVKFIASLHLMANNLKWPESFLTGKKGKIISNGFFARATLSLGLDKHIIRKRFTGAKWKPRYADDILSTPATAGMTSISSKVLADVIESLVGASYLTGSFAKAHICLQTLLPLEPWTSVPESNHILYEAVPSAPMDITSLATVERLIGYTFTKKMALLEALTHSSYKGPLANCSYERFEFLGDAVLDYIVSRRLYAHVPELGHAKMHGIRTAMANAAFLSYSMFELTVEEERTVPPDMRREIRHRCLWQFLRSDAPALVANRDVAIKQYDAVKEHLRRSLRQEAVFPWHVLAEMDAPKFLSDIVESVIGAIYVDSQGDVGACEVFLEKLGILGCLERILRDGVDCLHPKERLGILAVEKNVQYVKVSSTENPEGIVGAGKNYSCRVRVGGKDVGGVVHGVKKLNAETIAAWEACRVLEAAKRGAPDVSMEEVDHQSDGGDEWFDAEEEGGVALAE